jgi:hypothetical protein
MVEDKRNILDKASDFVQQNKAMQTLSDIGMARWTFLSNVQRPTKLDGTWAGHAHLEKVPEHLRNRWRVGIPGVTDIAQMIPGSKHVFNGLTFQVPEKLSQKMDAIGHKWNTNFGVGGKYAPVGKALKGVAGVADAVGFAQLGGMLYDWTLRKNR